MTQDEFVMRVLRIFNAFTGPDHDELWWRCDGDYAPITFMVNCSDLHWWGTADSERVTPDNVALLEKAREDGLAVDPKWGGAIAVTLFCCRVRKLRPQGACYKHIEEKYWPLLDACGPEREVDFANPQKQPQPQPQETT